jgi:hypothetical protein
MIAFLLASNNSHIEHFEEKRSEYFPRILSCTFKVLIPLEISKDAKNPLADTVIDYKNGTNASPSWCPHSLPCSFVSPSHFDSVNPAEDRQGHLAASK